MRRKRTAATGADSPVSPVESPGLRPRVPVWYRTPEPRLRGRSQSHQARRSMAARPLRLQRNPT